MPVKTCNSPNNERPIEILQRPTTPNDHNEVDVHNLCDWTLFAPIYGTFATKGSVKVYKARTYYQETGAVAEVAWSPNLDKVDDTFAIRVNNKVFHILAAINVDERNETIDFYLKQANGGESR